MMPPLSAANVLAWSIQAGSIAAAALATIAVARIAAPGVRYTLLRVVLALCLVMPFLQGVRPAPIASQAAAAVATAVAPQSQAENAPARSALPVPVTDILLVVIVGGILGRVGWIAAGIVRLRRLRRAGDGSAAEEHADLQTLVGTRAELRYVDGLGQPVTFGFRRPVVLLPSSLRGQPVATQRAVVAHELWHVRRRDWPWTVAEELLRAALWFHPVVWLLLSRIQAAREEVVDELSILSIGSRRAYVEALLAFADERPLFAATAFARRRHLVQRIVLISKEAVMSGRRVVVCATVLAAVVAATARYTVHAFPLTEAKQALEVMAREPGPLERAASPITPENPVPARLTSTNAEYPAEAASVNARGLVQVRLTVDANGRVAEARVAEASLRFYDNIALSFRNEGGQYSSAMGAEFCCTPDGSRARFESLRPAVESLAAAAVDAVKQWSYAPPVNAPISFTIAMAFVPPHAPAAVDMDVSPVASGRDISAGAVRVGGGIKPPQRLKNVFPVYPPIAQSARVQGVVVVEARVEADGRVSDARVLRSIPLLDQAAIDAVKQWEFEPTLLNGVPTPIVMVTTINFTLN